MLLCVFDTIRFCVKACPIGEKNKRGERRRRHAHATTTVKTPKIPSGEEGVCLCVDIKSLCVSLPKPSPRMRCEAPTIPRRRLFRSAALLKISRARRRNPTLIKGSRDRPRFPQSWRDGQHLQQQTTAVDDITNRNAPVTTLVSASLSLPMCHVLKMLDWTIVPKGRKPSFGGTSGRLLPMYVKNP